MSLRQAAEQIIAWYAEGQHPTAEMAMEALERCQKENKERLDSMGIIIYTYTGEHHATSAIDMLRKTLAQPEQEPMDLRQAAEQIIAWYAEGQRPTGDDIVDTLREALAQPERRCEAGVSLQDLWNCWDAVYGGKQEPVAWKGVKEDSGFPFLGFHEQPGMEPLYLHPASIPEGWQSAFDHYERALKASWPEGAEGEAFTHWNEARKALAQQDRKCEADPYAELKAAARDPTKQVRLRGSEIWVEGDFYVFDEPPENYEIRNKPLADPMQNLKMAEES